MLLKLKTKWKISYQTRLLRAIWFFIYQCRQNLSILFEVFHLLNSIHSDNLTCYFLHSFIWSSFKKKKETRKNVNGYWKWIHKCLNRIILLHSVTLLSHSQLLFSLLFCWNVCCELISTLLFWQSFQLYSCKFKSFWNIDDRFNRNFSDILKWWEEKKIKLKTF